MVFRMKLFEEPFKQIKTAEKTVELRLYDEKRRKLSLGDYIIFSKVDNMNEQIAVKVKGLYRGESFRDLFDDISIEKCGYDSNLSPENVVESLRMYYSEEEEERYGVLAIKIEVCNLNKVKIIEDELAEAEFDYFFPDGMK